MEKVGTSKDAPMLIRAYKKEAEFEVWKMGSDGHYVHLKTFPMCRWSGQLGPRDARATARCRRASMPSARRR